MSISVIYVANGLLFFAIMLDSALRARKEMVIMAGMAAVDIIYGLGVILLGIYRICLYLSGEDIDDTSEWACIVLPAVFLTIIATQLTSVMNLIVSLDRFIAVAWPLQYYTLDRRYALKMMVGVLFSVKF
jgi:hypothetical protein